MESKYDDIEAATQVIGALIENPQLLDDDGKYTFNTDDFTSSLHTVVFAAVTAIYNHGGNSITADAIEDFLVKYPQSKAIYDARRGNEWVEKAIDNADIDNFDLYYWRLKKTTLIREYDKAGIDMTWLWDPDELDPKVREMQSKAIDSMSVDEIAESVDDRLSFIREKYVDNFDNGTENVGDGIDDFLKSLKGSPDVGAPLYGPLINTVTRGARLGKFYMRSAPTGVGKSRSMIADACYMACDEIYDTARHDWVSAGASIPALFISTELDLNEVQSMCIAFLSGVNEEHILTGIYDFGEEKRVFHAAEILKKSPLYVTCLFDYGLKDIENCIKRNYREHGVTMFFFDYIMTTLKILSEITSQSGGVKLREDNILFMMSCRLKDLANQLHIFIMTSTQVSANFKTEEVPDQTLLRGAKSLADKLDVGMLMLDVTAEDIEKLQPIISATPCPPNVKMSVYKNRRGSYNRIFLWMHADKGTCRYEAMYATDFNYNPIEMDDLRITLDELKEDVTVDDYSVDMQPDDYMESSVWDGGEF